MGTFSLAFGKGLSQQGTNLNLLYRGNIVGRISVTPDSYSTNNGATTITVGASGANYTTINAAYAAAVAGDVIEILDDSTILSSRLTLTKTVNAQGKSIKIKGKSTKSTIILASNGLPIYNSTDNASIEFENIIFTEPTNALSYYYYQDKTGGFHHFINCDFNCKTTAYLKDGLEIVFDNCTWDGTNISSTANYVSSMAISSKLLYNNCTFSSSLSGSNLCVLPNSFTNKLNLLSVTNSAITTKSACISGRGVSSVNIRGNSLHSTDSATITLGYETVGLAISPFAEYDNSTSYVVGNFVTRKGILYRCKVNCTGETPDKDNNANWEIARQITGNISNNKIFRTTYVTSGHGVFLGAGVNDVVIENNIFNNYWYNLVVKGVDNIIRYNAFANGLAGNLSIFTNDQKEVRNNSFRAESGCIEYGPNGTGGEGLVKTTFRDNIIVSSSGNAINDVYERWVDPPSIQNLFINNKFYGTVSAKIGGETYNLATQLNDYKTASGDLKAEYINPEFDGLDYSLESYYLPTNPIVLKMKDQFRQAVGAVDYTK